MKVEFKESAEFNQLIEDCRTLNFDYLKEGPQGLLDDVETMQTTPKDTGYTEEHNAIWRNGDEVIIGNTNTDYGQYLYDSGRSFKQEKNKRAKDRWYDITDDNYAGLVEIVVDEIGAELRNRK